MNNTCKALLGRFGSFAGLGVLAATLAAGPVWAQSEQKEKSAADAKPAQDAKDNAKDSAKDSAKDTTKDAKDSAKESTSSAKDSAKESAKDTAPAARDRAKDAPRDAAKSKDRSAEKSTNAKADTKGSARTTRDQTRETAKETRDTARDTTGKARDAARDTRETTRETAQDARDSGRDLRDRRDADETRNARDRRDARDEPDRRDLRDTRDRDTIRDADRRDTERRDIDRRDIDRRDIDRREIDRRDIDRSDIDRRDVNRRDIDRREVRNDVRTDVRSRRDRDISRTRIENFRAESVTARDLGISFSRVSNRGLVIDDLSRTTVFADLGLRRGDVILSVADHRVRSDRDFIHYLFERDIRNEVVTIVVLRDGREVPIEVRPVTIIEEILLVQEDIDPLHHFGIVVDDRRPNEVVVVRVIPDSPAFVAGIRPGDVITTFHGDPVRGRSEFVEVIEQVQPGEVAVRVNRNRQVRELTVDMPRLERSTAVRRSAARPDFDVDRPAIERREERRENRIERRDERRDGAETTAVPVEPAPPAVPAQPSRPLLPRPFRGNR